MSKNLQQVRSASTWRACRWARFGLCASLLLLANLCWAGEDGAPHATPVYETTNRVVFKPCGRWPERMRGPVYALQMVDNHVYAAVMGSGLAVYEITPEGGLWQEGCWPLLGAVYAVAVQGHFAYVGLEDEVAVVDVTDPKAIKEVARIQAGRDIQTLAVSGTLAFLPAKLGEKDGVALVDVNDPTRPRRVGEFTTDAEVQCIAAKDGYAFVACGKGGLGVWDCREPAQPRQTGGFKTQGPAISVFVLGSLAYLLDGAERFVVLDLSDASRPALLGSVLPEGAAYWHWDRIWAAGNYVYLAGQADLDVVDVREPRHPKVVRTVWQANSQAIAGAKGWLIAWGERGLTAYDLVRPENPVRRGSLPAYARANDVKVRGGYAFVADAGGLRVLDVHDPASPREVAWTKLPGFGEVVRLAGNHAFVMEPYCPDGPSIVQDPPIFGLQVIDISRPNQPVKVNRSSVTNHNHLKGFALANGWAYLMDNCLRPVDLNDLTAPRLAGEAENRRGVRYNDICGVSNRLYVAGSTGLEIYDVSTPSQPHLMGTLSKDTRLPDYRTGGFCVDVAWPYAYVGVAEAELQVMDVTIPTKPKLVGSCRLPGLATCLHVQGKHVFAADAEGIRAVDVSRPEHPVLAGKYALPGEIKRIAVEGDYVYVCDWRDLIILRLEYPAGN